MVEGRWRAIVLKKYIDAANELFYLEVHQTYTPKGLMYTSPTFFDVPVDT